MDFDPTRLLDLSQPINLLAYVGGFVYLEVAPDGLVQLCACNALTEAGAALEFDGPFGLDRLDLGDRLYGDNRVQAVTMGALTDLGVQKFGWLGPQEAVWSKDGKTCLADGSGCAAAPYLCMVGGLVLGPRGPEPPSSLPPPPPPPATRALLTTAAGGGTARLSICTTIGSSTVTFASSRSEAA
jgi:hypothetical protein